MSADNGIYILESPGANGKEYRVALCFAIDNIFEGTKNQRRFSLKGYFGKSTVHADHIAAIIEAANVAKQYGLQTEYGICDVKIDYPYPKD